MTYKIYHIPGIKIGCTERDVAGRVKEQGYIDFEILEEHDDIDIADERERILQEEYNYEVEKRGYKRQSESAKVGGAKTGCSTKLKLHLDAVRDPSAGGKAVIDSLIQRSADARRIFKNEQQERDAIELFLNSGLSARKFQQEYNISRFVMASILKKHNIKQ